jgi:hypothetical protein
MTRITLAAAVALFSTVAAAQERFHDAAGRVVGSERTDANGVTTFSDAAGRTTGLLDRRELERVLRALGPGMC